MKNNLTTFYIVRHGESEGNKNNILQGHTDFALTPTGEDQARKVAELLRDVHFDEAFSSDLIRAHKTAEIIALEKKLAIRTTQALRERFYGKFQGSQRDEFMKLYKAERTTANHDHWTFRFGDEETYEEAITRYILFLRETAVAFPEKTILIASHSGIMRTFLIKLGHWTWERYGKIGNCGYIIVQSDGIDFFLNGMEGVTDHE